MEADRVVVELIAKVDGFDGKVKASTAGFEDSMSRIQASATKAEATVARSSDARVSALRRESAQISQFSRMLGTQINDVGSLMVAPSSPFVVPVKQAPAVSSAMKLVLTSTSAMAGVMGGVAVTAAIALGGSLIDLIFKNKDTAKEVAALVEKMREQANQARLNALANEIWENSLDGLIEKTRKLSDETDRAIKSQSALTREELEGAEASLRRANEIKASAEARMAAARAEVEAARAAFNAARARVGAVGPEDAGQAAVDLAAARARLGRAQNEVRKIAQELNGATVAAGNAANAAANLRIELARVEATALADPIKAKYDAMRKAAEDTIKDLDRLTARLAEIDRLEKKAREEARKRPAAPDREVGGRLTSEQARALVNAQFGAGSVTSGRRTPERNAAVDGAANSFHLTGQAIDVKKAVGISLNKLKALISAQGVIIEEALDEGDHFHIAWRNARTQAERLAAEQKRLADAEANRAQAFDNERAALEDSVLDARQALLTSADEIALIELAAIDLARDKYADQVAHNVAIGKLHKDEAKALLDLNDERAKLRAEAVQRRVDERNFRIREAEAQRRLQAQTGEIGIQAELLQSRQGLATTIKDRRDLERRLIDLQFQEEKLQLEAIIAETERLKLKKNLTDAEKLELEAALVRAGLAQQQLATLGERQANAQAGNALQNAAPLQDFFSRIPNDAAEVNEALESIAAGGLASISDALATAIVNWRGFGDAARGVLLQVAQSIIKLGIQQLLLATVGKVIGKAATAATVAQATAAASAWAPAAALASLATLGANAGPAAAALAATNALAMGIAAASGAAGAGAGFRWGGYTGDGPVDQVAGPVHRREFVFDAASTRRIGVRNLEAIRSGRFSPSNAVARQPGRGGGAGGDYSELRSIVQEAITAMPPVQLFPTYDPVDAFEAAINNNRGRRVFLDFLGANSGAANGALQRNQ